VRSKEIGIAKLKLGTTAKDKRRWAAMGCEDDDETEEEVEGARSARGSRRGFKNCEEQTAGADGGVLVVAAGTDETVGCISAADPSGGGGGGWAGGEGEGGGRDEAAKRIVEEELDANGALVQFLMEAIAKTVACVYPSCA